MHMNFESFLCSFRCVTVHFSSSAFFLCLCPEFLGALASFFNIPKEEEDDTQLPEEMLTKTASADTAATSSKEVATPAAAPGRFSFALYGLFSRIYTLVQVFLAGLKLLMLLLQLEIVLRMLSTKF